MKSKYEISVWSDIYDPNLGRFVEQKEIIIGSNTMTSESRARDPKLVNNINGTNKFSFNLYYSYIDTRTGEEITNPYVPYLVNERKIKVLWKDEWYDFLIKQIKEDSVNHLFTYNCEDSYITELSRNGFELEFATELENNIGTAQELVTKTLENTDWMFDEEGSDFIYQETEEAVYEVTILNDFTAYLNPENTATAIQSGKPALVYYSCASDKDTLKSYCQFYYNGTNKWQQDQNDMLVINGNCYGVNVIWEVENTTVTALVDGIPIFIINFATGLSTKYRAKRFVQSQKTVYNNILDRYVNVYNDGALYGYQTTEYNDALAVVNLVTNPSNFKNVSGWVGDELYFKLSPGFDSTTQISTYTSTSFLKLKAGTYFNTGIQNNRPYIPNGFIEGEKYIFRIRARMNGDEPSKQDYISNPNLINPYVQGRNSNYFPDGPLYFETTNSFYDSTNKWLEYDVTCIKSCPYDMILSSSYPFGIFLDVPDCWIEEFQFFREVYGSTGYDEAETVRIDPGQMNLQSIAQVVWKYFNAEQPAGTTKNSLEYVYTSPFEWSGAVPVYNNFERYGTIEESNSNRFNILQTIAETFECWVRFKIEHDEKGYIKYNDEGAPLKWVQLKKEAGQETGIGFIYGVDLKGIVRNIKSDKISTKTIVSQNENEFGKNGFCSIARSEQNYPRENFIYNFDYYIQQGLLDGQALYNDLYNTAGLAYYSKLHDLNTQYDKNLQNLLNKKSELTKQSAMSTVYTQYISSALDELHSIEDSLIKLAGVTSFAEVEGYIKTHYRDTKVKALMNNHSLTQNMIDYYNALSRDILDSITLLEEYIDTVTARQSEIIDELTALNKQFYAKYARFIQEGTWTSEDYWDDDLYYLDALQVAYTSSRPQILYEINVLRLSDLADFKSKVFHLGDISFVQDVKYFGYMPDKITPYKEKVILSEITSFFDTPDKDIVKVQNYKNQFDDLFQRITAATQSLEFSEGKYARAANIINSDGTIKSSVIQNTFDTNKDLVYGAQNESVSMDNTGITVTNNDDAAHLVKITSGGVFVSEDGGETWKNAIRGDGVNTDLLTAGRINTEQITIYNGDFPSFRWDPNGLNAYKFNEDGSVDTTQFVRFDQYGIYGMQNADEVYVPSSEQQIYNDANFGLTWSKFFMKSVNGDKSIEISTEKDIVVKSNDIERVVIGRVDGASSDNYGIRIRNEANDIVFQCDNNGSYLSGWTLTKDYLESETSTSTNNNIRIYADGNIGCYAHDPYEKREIVYEIQTSATFSIIGINAPNTNVRKRDPIYPFVSNVGKTKVEYQVSGSHASHGKTYDNAPTVIKPVPPSTIQLVYSGPSGEKNYQLTDINWDVQQKQMTYVEYPSSGKVQYTTYTYTFNLVAKKNDSKLFTIPYTDTFNTTKSKYIPASDTKWKIDNEGDAIFHEIYADGGSIAGWWIDDEKIYQTVDGTRNGRIKTQLNSNGTARTEGFDYSIITDAINASMAKLGGVLLQNGLVGGFNLGAIYQMAVNAASTASSAYNLAGTAYNRASDALETANGASFKASHHQHGAGTFYVVAKEGTLSVGGVSDNPF